MERIPDMMTSYLKTPLLIMSNDGVRILNRPLQDEVPKLDNLVELVVFTPRGSFVADPDFGFEYWNHEYTNVYLRDFSNGQKTIATEVTRKVCEDSIRKSIASYVPTLKHVDVEMQLLELSNSKQSKRKTSSKYEVIVEVKGELDNGLGTMRPYSKTIRFLMEPTAKTI